MQIHKAEHTENHWTFTVKTDDGLPIHVHCHLDDPEEVSIGDWGEVDPPDDTLARLYVKVDGKMQSIIDVIRAVAIKAPHVIEETLAEEASLAALERDMKEVTR